MTSSVVPNDFKPPQRDFFISPNARLAFGDCNLLLDGINAFKVGQEQAAPSAVLDNHAVASNVKGFGIKNSFWFAEDINAIFNVVKLVSGYWFKARVS